VRPFAQVDVFTHRRYAGNPVAVVLDGAGLDDAQMQQFASWTNLSETTFVLPPTDADADYRIRIFTTTRELPFAGHPTLGTCHAWLTQGGSPRARDEIVQECGAGLIAIRRSATGLAFAAPALTRSGSVDDDVLTRVASQLRIDRATIVDAQWADNGHGWVAVMLGTVDEVLAIRPGVVDMDIGVVAPYGPGAECAFELRAFFPKGGATAEDPVTGSLNAAVAQWLLASGEASSPYVASQGTVLGRAGRVHVEQDADGRTWVGGGCVTCIAGTVDIPGPGSEDGAGEGATVPR
jgi:PhzF family phenazine biosynthesis protein